MFDSAELDCQSAQNDVRVVKKLATLKADDAGGTRLQTLLLAYPLHEAILFHEVDLSRYDLDRRLYSRRPSRCSVSTTRSSATASVSFAFTERSHVLVT